jgi:hypothetical protein
MAHVIAVHHVEHASFSLYHYQVRMGSALVRQQHRPAGSEVAIILVQVGSVVGGEVVTQPEAFSIEFQQGVTIIPPTSSGIESPIPRSQKYMAGLIRRRPGISFPNAGVIAIGRCIKD